MRHAPHTRHARLVLLLLVAVLLGACAGTPSKPLPAARDVDLARYLGKWYVIANIPYFAERGKLASYVVYRQRPDGKLDDLYFYKKSFKDTTYSEWKGVAWLPDARDPARWKVRFIWPFTSDYTILDVGPGPAYDYALIGLPSRDLLWIFARTPTLDARTYDRLLAKARALGFPVDEVKKIPQMPVELGQPGFQ